MKFLKFFIIFLSIIPVILTIAGLLARLRWDFSCIASFKFQLLCIQLVLFFVLFVIIRKPSFLHAFFGFFILINLIPLVYLYIPPFRGREDVKNRLKILSANVQSTNDKYDLLISGIKEEEPDIIVLSEANSRWIEALDFLDEDYYPVKHPGEYLHGLALYSKIPFLSSEIKYYEYYETLKVPMIFAKIETGGKIINLIAFHPIAPKDKSCLLMRDSHLDALSSLIIKEKRENIILCGDMNITPWDYNYSEFLNKTGLKDSTKGFGYEPSWPSHNPFLLIPIDHCFTDRDFVILKRKIMGYTGSDHYPLKVVVGW